MTHWTEETFIEQAAVFRHSMQDRLEGTDEEVAQLLSLLGDHGVEPETALDVACGIGRHSVELAKQGVTPHGLDLSESYIESARARAESAGVSGEATFEVGDMRELASRDGSYDLVMNMWTAFGYFDDETNEAVANGFRERVAEDGALVMELANKEFQMANYQDSSAGLSDGDLYVERREYTPETGRLETAVAVFDHEESDDEEYEFVGEMEWDLRLYAPAELRRLLERAGFGTVDLYGGLGGSPLERDSHRLIVVAQP